VSLGISPTASSSKEFFTDTPPQAHDGLDPDIPDTSMWPPPCEDLDPSEDSDTDAHAHEREDMCNCDGHQRQAPTQIQAVDALKDLKVILHPPWEKGPRYQCPNIDPFVRIQLEGMQTMLNLYTNPCSVTYEKWGACACQAAVSLGRGQYCAHQLARLLKQFVLDRTILPINPYGTWNESMLIDEDLASNINLHLLELRKEILAKKIVEFLAHPDTKEKHGITKTISERTASRYLNTLGYRFTAPKKGQYADGHERADVVWYWENIFLPAWCKIQDCTYSWTQDNLPDAAANNNLQGRHVVVWFHNESIFYAHD